MGIIKRSGQKTGYIGGVDYGKPSSNDSGYKTGTVGSTTLYSWRDPKTGVLQVTGSKDFAETSSVSGTPKFTKEYQERHRSGGGSGGSSYVDTSTGKRVDVSPSGVKTEVPSAVIDPSSDLRAISKTGFGATATHDFLSDRGVPTKTSGYSYVDTKTGKGYEVSPQEILAEVKTSDVFDLAGGSYEPGDDLIKGRGGSRDFTDISGGLGFSTITQRHLETRGAPSRSPFLVIPTDISPQRALSIGGGLGGIVLPPQLPGILPEASLKESQRRINVGFETFKEFEKVSDEFRRDPMSFVGKEGVTLKTTPEGDLITLTPEFFDMTLSGKGIEERAKIITKHQLSLRPTKDIITSRLLEVGYGGVGLVIGAGEFAIGLGSKLGVQTFEEGKPMKESFKFGGILGDIRSQPQGFGSYLGKSLIAVPAIGTFVSGFTGLVGTGGIKYAIGETVTGFSPFKIPTQTFGALEGARAVKDLKFDVASFKSTQGDITKRFVVGKARGYEDVTLMSKQISKSLGGNQVGFATTSITAPKTTYQLGKFGEGLRFVKTESIIGGVGGKASVVKEFGGSGELISFFSGKGGSSLIKDVTPLKIEPFTTKQLLIGVKGGGSQVFTRTRINLGYDPIRGLDGLINLGKLPFMKQQIVGGVSRGLDSGVNLFGTGRGREILKIGREGGALSIRVKKFNIRGLEFDLGKVFGDTSISKTGISMGGGRGGAQLTSKQLSASVSSLTQLPSQTTTTTKNIVTSLVGAGFKTDYKQKVIQKQKPITEFKQPVISKSKIEVVQIPIARQRGRGGQALIPYQEFKPISKVDQLFVPIQLFGQDTVQEQKQKQIYKFGFETYTPATFDFGYDITVPGTPFPFLFPLPFGAPSRRKGKKVSKRKFQRTPSLAAVMKSELGIKQPKFSLAQERTGLFERAYKSPKIIKSLGPFRI